jgi:hypothetical protein
VLDSPILGLDRTGEPTVIILLLATTLAWAQGIDCAQAARNQANFTGMPDPTPQEVQAFCSALAYPPDSLSHHFQSLMACYESRQVYRGPLCATVRGSDMGRSGFVNCEQAFENMMRWGGADPDRDEIREGCAEIQRAGKLDDAQIQQFLTCYASKEALQAPACIQLRESMAHGQHRAKRAECPANVDGIKTAELGYDAAFDEFIAAPRHPRPSPDEHPVSWRGGNTGFQRLGWAPAGPVRGVYWVVVTDGGTDFEVHALCDVDGDGVPSHFMATKTTRTSMETKNTVY